MKMLTSCRQQKSKSFHIRGIVSEAEMQNVHIRYSLARTELNGSHDLIFMFEWKIFPRYTTLTPLQEVQNMMEKSNIQPESFKDRIIFMSMYSAVDWSRKGNEESCPSSSSSVAAFSRKFLEDIGHSSDPDLKKNGVLHLLTNQTVPKTPSLDE